MDAYKTIAPYYDAVTRRFLAGTRTALREICSQTGARRILDIGCGTGLLTGALYGYAEMVIGIDLSPAMLSEAGRSREHSGRKPVLLRADALHPPFKPGSFDLLVYSLVLHESCSGAERLLQAGLQMAPLALVLEWRPPLSIQDIFLLSWRHGIERLAGKEHYRQFKAFMRKGGVPALAERVGARLLLRQPLPYTGMAAYLLKRPDSVR